MQHLSEATKGLFSIIKVMKEFDLNGITYLRPVREGTDEWYYCLDYPDGDLYEAEELHDLRKTVKGNDLFLIHYPDGEVIRPIEKEDGTAIGEPVYHDGMISILTVDFVKELIRIYGFDCDKRILKERAVLPLSDVKDCYNLRLFEHPLTLTRQDNHGNLDIVWPLKKTISTDPKESFFYREDSRLYFNIWYEDPDYREETIVRDITTGEIIERMSGDIHIMPNGELWHLK